MEVIITSKIYGSTKIEHMETGNYKGIAPLLVETNMLRRAGKYDTSFMPKNPSHLCKILSVLY